MTSFPILDLVAGMIFLYFLMSILSNAVIEGLASISRIRATMLTKWIQENLPQLKAYFLNHTLLDGSTKGSSTPSYISSANFAFVLIDSICKQANNFSTSLDEIEKSIDDLEKQAANVHLPSDLARILKTFIAEARAKAKLANQTKTELELFRQSIETWFDSMMERVGGSFKRWASYWTLVVSAFVVLLLNIDSIKIAKYLYADENARNKLALAAYEASENSEMAARAISVTQIIDSVYKKPASDLKGDTILMRVVKSYQSVDSTVAKVASFIPIGWDLEAEKAIYKKSHNKTGEKACVCMVGFWVLKIFGCLMTIFAVMLGAPFWFDVLGKVANLRSSIKPQKT